MLVFIDDIKKQIFIVPPKCGNNTLCSYLGVQLHYEHKNTIEFLNDETFVKIMIIRDDLVDRFLSGFYEDLFNNQCYDDIDITFTDYLFFLHYCFVNKIPKVCNLNIYLNKKHSIYFGNCSNVSLPITNDEGEFISHIQTQKYTLKNFLNLKNIKLLKIKNLNKFLNSDIRKNTKEKEKILINLDKIKLCEMKNKGLIINKNCLNQKHIEIILDMYNEDKEFIQKIEKKYGYII